MEICIIGIRKPCRRPIGKVKELHEVLISGGDKIREFSFGTCFENSVDELEPALHNTSSSGLLRVLQQGNKQLRTAFIEAPVDPLCVCTAAVVLSQRSRTRSPSRLLQ